MPRKVLVNQRTVIDPLVNSTAARRVLVLIFDALHVSSHEHDCDVVHVVMSTPVSTNAPTTVGLSHMMYGTPLMTYTSSVQMAWIGVWS
jgi:hypothetical protein